MDNNNNFENGFYGSAPQKPFTDKSSDVPVNTQTFSGEGEIVNQTEQTAFDEQNLQNANTSTEQMQNVNYSNEPFGAENQTAPAQNTPEVHNAPQGAYRQNPDYAYPQYNAYAPYPPMPPRPPKKKANAGLIALIVVLCVLLVGSMAGFFVYFVSENSKKQDDNSSNSYSFTMPNYGYNIPSTEPTTAPVSEHKESDYSDKADANYKGVVLESKPKDADSNKSYTAESAFNKVSDSVVGIVGYTDEITTVENSATQGSGIILTSDGYVVTNAHVIGNSKTAYLLQVVTSDGKSYNAGVVGYDSRTDIAVLKMDDAKDLKAAAFGNSENIELGEDIIVVGNPGGLDYQNSITKGIVSAVDRKMSSTSLVKYIQTDAAINPGNSGGPIVNLYGQVVGIATAKIVSEKYEGMGFAIPSATAKDIIDTLMKKGYVEGRVKIGITGSNVSSDVASAYGIPMGIMVDEISKDGPCYGTELKTDDIITGVDDKEIQSFSDIYEILETHKPGDKIVIKYYRMSDQSTGEVEVTLAEDK